MDEDGSEPSTHLEADHEQSLLGMIPSVTLEPKPLRGNYLRRDSLPKACEEARGQSADSAVSMCASLQMIPKQSTRYLETLLVGHETLIPCSKLLEAKDILKGEIQELRELYTVVQLVIEAYRVFVEMNHFMSNTQPSRTNKRDQRRSCLRSRKSGSPSIRVLQPRSASHVARRPVDGGSEQPAADLDEAESSSPANTHQDSSQTWGQQLSTFLTSLFPGNTARDHQTTDTDTSGHHDLQQQQSDAVSQKSHHGFSSGTGALVQDAPGEAVSPTSAFGAVLPTQTDLSTSVVQLTPPQSPPETPSQDVVVQPQCPPQPVGVVKPDPVIHKRQKPGKSISIHPPASADSATTTTDDDGDDDDDDDDDDFSNLPLPPPDISDSKVFPFPPSWHTRTTRSPSLSDINPDGVRVVSDEDLLFDSSVVPPGERRRSSAAFLSSDASALSSPSQPTTTISPSSSEVASSSQAAGVWHDSSMLTPFQAIKSYFQQLDSSYVGPGAQQLQHQQQQQTPPHGNHGGANSPDAPRLQWPDATFPRHAFHRCLVMINIHTLQVLCSLTLNHLVKHLQTVRDYAQFWKEIIEQTTWFFPTFLFPRYQHARAQFHELKVLERTLTTAIGLLYTLPVLCASVTEIGGSPFDDGYSLRYQPLLSMSKTNVGQQRSDVSQISPLSPQDKENAARSLLDSSTTLLPSGQDVVHDQEGAGPDTSHPHHQHHPPRAQSTTFQPTVLDARPSSDRSEDDDDDDALDDNDIVALNPGALEQGLSQHSAQLHESTAHHPPGGVAITPHPLHHQQDACSDQADLQQSHHHHHTAASSVPFLPSPVPYFWRSGKYLPQTFPQIHPLYFGHSPHFFSIVHHLLASIKSVYLDTWQELYDCATNYFHNHNKTNPIDFLRFQYRLLTLILQPLTYIEKYRPPSTAYQHWPLLASIGSALGIAAYQGYQHRDVVQSLKDDLESTVVDFCNEHLVEPIDNITKRVFGAFYDRERTTTDGSEIGYSYKDSIRSTAEEVRLGQKELTSMLIDYGKKHAEDIAAIENTTKQEFLKTLEERARNLDMTFIMGKHIKDLNNIWYSLGNGSALSNLLIQVHKIKLDGLNAMMDIDQIIEQNQVNFNFMATMPMIMLVFGVVTGLKMLYTALTTRHKPSELLESIRASLHRIEIILIKANTSPAIDTSHIGHPLQHHHQASQGGSGGTAQPFSPPQGPYTPYPAYPQFNHGDNSRRVAADELTKSYCPSADPHDMSSAAPTMAHHRSPYTAAPTVTPPHTQPTFNMLPDSQSFSSSHCFSPTNMAKQQQQQQYDHNQHHGSGLVTGSQQRQQQHHYHRNHHHQHRPFHNPIIPSGTHHSVIEDVSYGGFPTSHAISLLSGHGAPPSNSQQTPATAGPNGEVTDNRYTATLRSPAISRTLSNYVTQPEQFIQQSALSGDSEGEGRHHHHGSFGHPHHHHHQQHPQDPTWSGYSEHSPSTTSQSTHQPSDFQHDPFEPVEMADVSCQVCTLPFSLFSIDYSVYPSLDDFILSNARGSSAMSSYRFIRVPHEQDAATFKQQVKMVSRFSNQYDAPSNLESLLYGEAEGGLDSDPLGHGHPTNPPYALPPIGPIPEHHPVYSIPQTYTQTPRKRQPSIPMTSSNDGSVHTDHIASQCSYGPTTPMPTPIRPRQYRSTSADQQQTDFLNNNTASLSFPQCIFSPYHINSNILLNAYNNTMSPRANAYVLLYTQMLLTLVSQLPTSVLSIPGRKALFTSLAYLTSSAYSIQQKLLVVQHIYRSFDIFTFRGDR